MSWARTSWARREFQHRLAEDSKRRQAAARESMKLDAMDELILALVDARGLAWFWPVADLRKALEAEDQALSTDEVIARWDALKELGLVESVVDAGYRLTEHGREALHGPRP